ncbi:MAG: hypothetical protein AAGB19_08360 [Cyanobacteria bacterium P01_F01_bin.3]
MRPGIQCNIFAATIAAFSLILTGCGQTQPRSGEALFKAVVQSPMPESVEVLHSQDEIPLFDPVIWLHFSTDTETYEQIIGQYAWEAGVGNGNENMPGPVAQWWRPEALDNVSRYQTYSEDCRCTKELWVDGFHQEVFFKVSF